MTDEKKERTRIHTEAEGGKKRAVSHPNKRSDFFTLGRMKN